MEGIPEKDMEERRRLLEQKTQGKVECGRLSVISLVCFLPSCGTQRGWDLMRSLTAAPGICQPRGRDFSFPVQK